jgi:pimeloyl-ACP methyl ester carboxylesterase
LLLPLGASAVEQYEDFPRTIHTSERYVIYSHGLIVEGDDPRPKHPEFGVYDFPAVRDALFRNGNHNLIAPHRSKSADGGENYVRKLEAGVRRLIAAGVAPGHITLVGFSRGAQLTAVAASRLRSTGINTALMAMCSQGDSWHRRHCCWAGACFPSTRPRTAWVPAPHWRSAAS